MTMNEDQHLEAAYEEAQAPTLDEWDDCDEDEEFHDTGVIIHGDGTFTPNCECGWTGERGDADSSFSQRNAHVAEMDAA